MAGSAFYGYHLVKGATGLWRVARNTGPSSGTGNYYRTKTKALKAASKGNKLLRRIKNPSLASIGTKWTRAIVRKVKGLTHIHLLGPAPRRRRRNASRRRRSR